MQKIDASTSENRNLKNTKFPLLRRLSIASLGAMLITAILLTVLYRQDQLAEFEQSVAEENIKTLIHLQLTLSKPIYAYLNNTLANPAEVLPAKEALDLLFKSELDVIQERKALKLKIYNQSGLAVYSSVASEIRGSSQLKKLLANALRGETVHIVESRDTFLGIPGEMHDVQLAITYMPLFQDGKQIGVFEIYDDASKLFERLQKNTIHIALIIFGAFATLYAVLFFTAYKADQDVAKWQDKTGKDEERLKFAIDGSGDGMWDWNPETDEALFSKRWKDMLGYAEDEFPATGKAWVEHIHPDDKDPVLSVVQAYFAGKEPSYAVEFRMRCKDGAWKWVLARGKLVSRDANGNPTRMLGTHTDISDRKTAELDLKLINQRMTLAANAAGIGIWDLNLVNNEVIWDDWMFKIYGIKKDDFGGAYEAWQHSVHPEDVERASSELQISANGGKSFNTDFRIVKPGGSVHYIKANAVVIQDDDGHPTRMIGTNIDITERKITEAEIQSLARFPNENPSPVLRVNTDGTVLYANKSARELLDYWQTDVGQKVPESFQELCTESLENNSSNSIEVGCADRYCELILAPIKDASYINLYGRDITERKRADADLRIAAVAIETQEAIVITDAQSNIIRVNNAFSQITGYSADEVLGKNPRIMNSGRHDDHFYIEMWQHLLHEGVWAGEIWDKRKNGEIFPKWVTITAVKNDDHETTHYVAIFTDITHRKQMEEEIHNLAYYDALTKLPNRRLFLDRFNSALSASDRHNDFGAVLFIDLDRFKALNDTHGHDYGDLLLVEVGVRIKSCVRDMDTVARFGGDEFVVLLEEVGFIKVEVANKVAMVAEKIRKALSQPYQLKSRKHHSSPSIGVRLYHGNDLTKDVLLEHADMAMYQAKSSGRNAVRFFDPVMQENVTKYEALDNDLHHALAQKELHLHYQLQVDQDKNPMGAEAFLRWIHPERGVIMPGQFLPIAEQSNLIIDIGHWIFETACHQLQLWSKNKKTKNLTLTLNISDKQFAHPEFTSEIVGILKKYNVDPTRLKLELSEKITMSEIDNAMEKITTLKDLGVRLSMDNFGAVYSSLSFIRQLSSDQLKIHRDFVQGIASDGNDAQLIKTIVNLAKSLDLNVFAEGVETEEQLSFLNENDCNSFQGYLFNKPVSIEDFGNLLGGVEI